jgi:hypothetical protein
MADTLCLSATFLFGLIRDFFWEGFCGGFAVVFEGGGGKYGVFWMVNRGDFVVD